MELEITWRRTILVWGTFFWRITIAILIGRGLSRAIVVLYPKSIEYPILIHFFSFLICIALSIILIKETLGKRFGDFRLVLVAVKKP
ncbi:MAG: hypothetical protein ACK5WY_01040 [Holosporaceae bacterium]|nr:hypothetical protein [Rhodospirillaceae bacterium]